VRLDGARCAGLPPDDRPRIALGHVRAGLDDLHAWQSSFGSLDLQTNVVGHGVQLAVRGLALAVRSRSDAVLFEWSERARMLASRIQPVRAPQDPRRSPTWPSCGPAERRSARRSCAGGSGSGRGSAEGSGEVADPVALAELQARLADDTALVAYVVTADRVVALVVTGRRQPSARAGRPSGLDQVLSEAAARPRHGGVRAARGAGRVGPGNAGAPARRGWPARLVEPLLDDVGDRRLVLRRPACWPGCPGPCCRGWPAGR
jgi:hypothetical protein